MRCLTLAVALRERGADCFFVCREYPGNLIEFIRQQGFEAHGIPWISPGSGLAPHRLADSSFSVGDSPHAAWETDAAETLEIIGGNSISCMIVDQYEICADWERRLRSVCRRVMVIDDLADRRHDCDLLLDQNLRSNAEARYRPLVPADCCLKLGPTHVLLRPAFDRAPTRARHGEVCHVLVYFGGNDQHNQAGRTLAALQNFPHLTAEIILGPRHPYRDALHAAASSQFVVLDTVNMAEAMSRADLAIGVCGIAAWERCAMGLPTLVCVNADNQREDAENLHRLGAVENLGESDAVNVDMWTNALSRMLADSARVTRMGEAAQTVVAGHTEKRGELLDWLCPSLGDSGQTPSYP